MTQAQAAVEKAKEQTNGKPSVITVEALIQQSAKQLGRALPAHMNAERLTRIALTTLRLNPKLYQCEPMSFLAALFQSAQLGLEPNVNGEAWIIPYNNKGGMVAQFQVGYLGFIKLFWNHQSSVSLQMETVFKNDEFSYDLGENKIHHKPPVFGDDRGPVIGYYAVAHLANGGRAIKVMSKNEAMAWARKFSKCFDYKTNDFYAGTPWRDHFDAMAMKTVLKQLMKLLPKSIEIQRALAMDETVKTKIDADMVQIPDETDYKELSLVGDGNTQNGTLEGPKADEKVAPINGTPTPSKATQKTALDIKIHEAKAELIKLVGGKDFYYNTLGSMGCEHMTELKPLEREVFLVKLQDKIKSYRMEK